MGFIAPFLPMIAGGVASAATGLLGGDKGKNFQAGAANIQNPTNQQQIGQSFDNTQSGIAQQQAFANALAAQGGVGNQANVFAQQQALAGQLGQMAQGAGPNPALAQLANTTGQNVAQQAALMGSQRGISANPGMLARQVAQQGAGIQQQSVGQAALLRAQQQLAAIQALQQQQGMLGNLSSAQVGQQQNALAGLNQFAQGQQQNLLGAQANYNNALQGGQASQNSANASIAAQNAKAQNNAQAGLIGGAGAAGTVLASSLSKPQGINWEDTASSIRDQGVGQGGGLGALAGMRAGTNFAQGGMVPASRTGQFLRGHYQGGAVVPGTAQVAGNSPKNDTVPAMLSPGEIVIPRSHAGNPDKAAEFARAVVMRNRKS